jgi:dihydrofolate synthase/folylpolyglutamate synthase
VFGLNVFGVGISLHRALLFLQEHGFDRSWLSRRSIIVTGTNGKGSTARFLGAALQAAGLKAGVFTSPHLFDVCERISIGDTPISRDVLDRHAQTVLAFNSRLPPENKLGAFELLFYAALLWFRETKPDVMVWEAGIGGRYDAVRTVLAKLSVLTSIELEHTEILGGTEELIALDKVDALAPGGTLILSPSVPRRLLPMIISYAGLADRAVIDVTEQGLPGPITNTPQGSRFTLQSASGVRDISLSLIGQHQVENALTALAAAEQYLATNAIPAPRDVLINALSGVRHPGRLERVATSPELWIDVGHTPGAIERVATTLLTFVPRERIIVVFGSAAGKQAKRMAEATARVFSDIILTAPYDISADVGELANAISKPGTRVEIQRDVATAISVARQRAISEGKSDLAIGGTQLAAKARHAWEGHDPRELEFL